MDFNNTQAIYLQIADYVSDQILMKKWLPDEKIPSVRELAMSLEVNPNTVMRSYEYLQNQNIIYTKRGMGYFVNNDAAELLNKLKKEQFLSEELPIFFHKMYIMGIELSDLNTAFEKFKQHNKEITK
ncbi:GntR family transcriptional regulator [Pedobacter punctiformis]|uniref:GntR family transcriptional regulator n=1 Tax=Pedobacter punctiformis TaxID=3004097 RepID=A0ABT4L9M2_9SPHI|nr:GntR family transcriptional regulator [Pedobacter sp. HCMS5-2]MCZ4244627.1 GntR family transcriptional regulator [Pedobacter sp. HCMS5-2]